MATSVTLKPNAIDISGSTSGTTTLQASAVAGTTTLTLPAATDTLVGKATTDTLTNKTLTTPTINQFSSAASTALTIQSAGTTAMTIDTSQNVGIGTSSPSYKLDVRSSLAVLDGSANIGFYANGTTYTQVWQTFQSPNDLLIKTTAAKYIAFLPNSTEAMRIDSSGNLLVGTSSLAINERLNVTTGNATGIYLKSTGGATYSPMYVWNATTTGDGYFSAFFTEASATLRGSITYNRGGGVVAYNTTSDYRLKENIVDLPNALATVAQLKPRQFNWKETGNTTTGFIAHELAEVCPHAVTGEKDAVDEEGNPKYQGVDTSFLVATLVAAIQEQQTIITALTARIEALEGK